MSMEERVIIQQQQQQEECEEVILDSPNNPFINHRNRCCFHFPCFSPSPSSSTTTRHVTLGGGPTQHSSSSVATSSSSSSSLWARFRSAPIRAFKKIREWSEIVAGPQWKTFIRRFNRKRRHHQHHHQNNNNGKFQYDPLSYALNFDEGQNGHFDHQDFVHNGHGHGQFPDFSSRLAASPKSPSSHLGNGVSAC